MSELGSINNEQQEIKISEDLLVEILKNPKFTSNLIDLANYARKTHKESGFIVQQEAGKIIIRDTVKNKKHVTSTGAINDEALASKGWIEDAETGELFKNMILAIHSHPLENWEITEDWLRPSTGDLEGWEEIRLESKNPYLMIGIVVNAPKAIFLLLCQIDPNRTPNTNYQMWDDSSDSVQKLFRLMEESGIRYEFLSLNKKTGIFGEKDLEKIKKFATN